MAYFSVKKTKGYTVMANHHLRDIKQRIVAGESDLAHYKAQPKVAEGISPMIIGDKTYTDKEQAGQALLVACKNVKAKESLVIGSYKGFDMSLSYDSFSKEFHLDLQRELSYSVTLGTSELGNITRIENALDSIEKRVENSKEQLETVEAQLETAKSELGRPFPQEDELNEKLARLAELNTLLNIDDNAIENASMAAEKKADPVVADKKPDKVIVADKKPSISYDNRQCEYKPSKDSVLAKIRREQEKAKEKEVYNTLCNYFHLLNDWRKLYFPKSDKDKLNPLFVKSLTEMAYVEYLLNCVSYGSKEEKAEIIKDESGEIAKIENALKLYGAQKIAKEMTI